METTQGTYALGGWDEYQNERSEVFQLDCPGDQIERCQWQEMEEKLEFPRSYHVSIALTKSSDICSGTTTITSSNTYRTTTTSPITNETLYTGSHPQNSSQSSLEGLYFNLDFQTSNLCWRLYFKKFQTFFPLCFTSRP